MKKPRCHIGPKGNAEPTFGEERIQGALFFQFRDPGFASLSESLDKIADVAWDAYRHSRKSPHTRKAGAGYADPDYELAEDWLAAHEAVGAAQRRHEGVRSGPGHIKPGMRRNLQQTPERPYPRYVQPLDAFKKERADYHV